METAGKILIVVCALLLAISASLAQPADPDRFDPDLEYTMPEAPPPRSAGKFARDNGLGHLLLKNLRFRDVQRMPTWLMKLNARVPESADDSAHSGFIERKAVLISRYTTASRADITSGCVNSWAELQADDFHFVCRGCTTVKYLQEQVIELRRMILMMTGQGETEVNRGGENDESRGGETEESRGGETEESRGGETEENKESSGNVREKAGKKKKDDRRQRMQQKRGKRVSGEGLPGGKTVKVDDRRERGHTSSVQQERSFADVVSQGKARKARVFMGDSIIRKVDKIVNRGDDITVCLPGPKVEDIAEKAGQVMGGGTGGAVLVHVGTNNADKEGTSAIIAPSKRDKVTLDDLMGFLRSFDTRETPSDDGVKLPSLRFGRK
ncbi:hypothetical protein LSAT2_025923 [Lamellibrachia satsuma]|nr:hypothetical protein LSAT2_025923 [Lamellibrachia satsuma]